MPHPLLAPAYELADGDKAFLAEILESMLNAIPEDIEGIEKAIENNQPSLAQRCAHHMKSSIMYTNAEELKELLAAIEGLKEQSVGIDQVKAILPKAKDIANELVSIIKAEQAS